MTQKVFLITNKLKKKQKKNLIRFDDAEIQEYELHQYKSPISMKNTDINKISNEFFLISKILNISLVMKKLDLYAFFFQK